MNAWRALRRAASALASAIREASYWQRRIAVLRLAPDRYLEHPDRPADTYAEFLARTQGPLLHEPSARARRSGRPVG
jgi:hypothetical protein